MIRSLYSGVSGLKAFQTKLDVIGNNVANANTVGYKKSRVVFEDMLSTNLSGSLPPTDGGTGGVNPRQLGTGTMVSAIDVVHTPGSPSTTNIATDLSIDGDGYFVVSPSGSEPYFLTRAGNFKLDVNGDLVTSEGYYVMSADSDKVNIDRETYKSFSINKDGEVLGTDADGKTEVVSTIGTAVVPNPEGLKKIGNSLYAVTSNADPDGTISDKIGAAKDTGAGNIIAGQLEMSNVDLTEEFADMIVAQRGFQANSRVVTTSDSILEEIVNLKR